MKIKYSFFQEEKLLVYRAFEEFSIDEWKNFYHSIMVRKEWEHIENMLIDLRETNNLTGIICYVPEMKRFRKEVIKKDYQTIFLADNPDNTVFTHIYKNEIYQDFSCCYCSTNEYALKQLKLKKTLSEFEGMIYSLDEEFCI